MHHPGPLAFRERQPLQQVGVGAASWTSGVRLPEGRWWAWVADNGPVSVRLVYGQIVTPALETLAAAAFSENHVHPGHDVYVQVQAGVGVNVLFFVVD